ncbi:hypothetical protein [Streptomyces sp. T028]|uniref:hypothetical protein n=1 Tax=Streptomyces sp. T028 TaxID=3394379 RepID=UPI003A8BAA85
MRGHAIRAARKLTARKLFLLVAALGLTVPLALTTAPPAGATALPALHVRTANLPLSGEITGASEKIDITGSLAVTVITRTNPGGGGTAQFISALGPTTGVGQTTGGTYWFVGADNDVAAWPPDPVSPVIVTPTFLQISPFYPPGPIVPPHPITFVKVAALITGDGEINDIAALLNLIENPDSP